MIFKYVFHIITNKQIMEKVQLNQPEIDELNNRNRFRSNV